MSMLCWLTLSVALLIHSLGHTGCRGRVNTAPDFTFSPLLNLPSGAPSNCPAARTQVKSGGVWTQTKQSVFWPISTKKREAGKLHSEIFLKEAKQTLKGTGHILPGMTQHWRKVWHPPQHALGSSILPTDMRNQAPPSSGRVLDLQKGKRYMSKTSYKCGARTPGIV